MRTSRIAAAALALALSPALAQQLLDRVVARVGTTPIMLSDVRAAAGLGLIEIPAGSPPPPEGQPDPGAVDRLIDRELVLAEVARFPPPEPPAAAVDAEVARMKAHAGAGLDRLVRETGLDEQRLRDLARDTLRIRAYMDERFGTSAQVSDDEVRRYYDTHPEEFTSNGRLVPFAEAEPEARRRASDERLQATVTEWVRGLRDRAEIVENP